jgi:hypothetical protein
LTITSYASNTGLDEIRILTRALLQFQSVPGPFNGTWQSASGLTFSNTGSYTIASGTGNSTLTLANSRC